MKQTITLFALLCFVISCNPKKTHPSETIVLGDTIQTESGLQYFYIKKGDGRKVASGSQVSTYLSLKIKDSVVWTSDNDTDSLFTFIMNGTTLIKGFNEVAIRLRQGDEIVAIIPDSLGYGDEGSEPVVPPNATLVYDKFKVVKVDEPRSFLADTLFATVKKLGIEKAIERNITIATTADSINYHQGLEQFYYTWEKLTNEKMYVEAVDMATYFASSTNNSFWMRSLMVQSLRKLGERQRAIDTLEVLVQDFPKNEYLSKTLKKLKEKVTPGDN